MERKDGPYWAQMMDGEDCVVERARGFYWQPGVEVSMPFSLLTNLEPIPTRDELRELRERLRKLDAAVRCHMAVEFKCLPSSIPDAAVTSLIDELDRLDAASDNPRKATP